MSAPLAGLGTDIALVRRVIAGDPVALDLLDRELKGRQGERTDLVSNVNEVEQRPAGNTKDRALRKLRADAPALHAEVLEGRLTAHAAMVQAGFRPRTVTVPVERPASVAAALRKHMTEQQLAELKELL